VAVPIYGGYAGLDRLLGKINLIPSWYLCRHASCEGLQWSSKDPFWYGQVESIRGIIKDEENTLSIENVRDRRQRKLLGNIIRR
jgi:hypothetical protein